MQCCSFSVPSLPKKQVTVSGKQDILQFFRTHSILSLLAICRAADRLYAHAVQKRARQQAAKESQAQEEKNSRHPSPGSRAFSRHASDFFQRQQVDDNQTCC